MTKATHTYRKTVLMPMAYSGSGKKEVWVYKRMPRENGAAPFCVYEGNREIGNANTLAQAMLMMSGRTWSNDYKKAARNKRRSK